MRELLAPRSCVFEAARKAPPMTALPETPTNREERRRARSAPSPNAFAYTLEDARLMGGPGRTTIYELAKRGELKLIYVGGRTKVDGDSLRALLGVTV